MVNAYKAWLCSQTKIHIKFVSTSLRTPADFESIGREALKAVRSVSQEFGDRATIFYHLSSGTMSMSAVWLLIGKGVVPGKFLQVSKEEGVKEVTIPFEMVVDFLPDLLQRREASLPSPMVALGSRSFGDIVHNSEVMNGVIGRANTAALYESPVLLEGETGTGKELFARAIHSASKRTNGSFYAVNCGAMSGSTVNGELFGWKKGAFTDAKTDRKGLFEQADGGSLFLDEVGELTPDVQVRILRAIQEGEIQRLGDQVTRKVSVRVIAATNRELQSEVVAGRFREDLFYRLSVLVIKIPPLRVRGSDISLLADSFIARMSKATGEERQLTTEAKQLLEKQHWPGNVRELQATLHRAWVWSGGKLIGVEDIGKELLGVDLPKSILDRSLGGGFSVDLVIEEVKRHYVQRALAAASENLSKAAELLGLSRQTLTNWTRSLETSNSHTPNGRTKVVKK
ncbi:MAG: sigma 54-interacting transcriptional regulator [Deltaproteobacteria bacterium]|nr:sigma 54-interacting transcriptional regulator [Deltaproteobacteria bacterium]